MIAYHWQDQPGRLFHYGGKYEKKHEIFFFFTIPSAAEYDIFGGQTQ